MRQTRFRSITTAMQISTRQWPFAQMPQPPNICASKAKRPDMPNHPNRGQRDQRGPNSNPTKEQVRAAREAAGLTQTAAARLIYSTMRAWQEWEAGNRRMHPGLWELYQIKLANRVGIEPTTSGFGDRRSA